VSRAAPRLPRHVRNIAREFHERLASRARAASVGAIHLASRRRLTTSLVSTRDETTMRAPARPHRGRRRPSRARVANIVACAAMLAFACARTVRAFDDAWLDGIDDEFDDEAAGAPPAMVSNDDDDDDDARRRRVDAYVSEDVDAFMDAFDDDDEDGVEAEIRALMREMADGIQTTTTREDDEDSDVVDASEDVETVAAVDVNDDDDMAGVTEVAEETTVDVVPVPEVEEVEEVEDEAVDVGDARDDDVAIVEEVAETDNVVDDDDNADDRVVDDAEVIVEEDGGEEDGGKEDGGAGAGDVDEGAAQVVEVFETTEGVDEDTADVDGGDTDPNQRRSLLGNLFSRFGAPDEESIEDDSAGVVFVEAEEPEFVEEPVVAIPEVAIVSVEEKEPEQVEVVPVPISEPVKEIPRAEPTKAPDAQNEETARRKLLEAQQQAASVPAHQPVHQASEAIYVGNYWKRANPYHKGPRVKVVDA